MNDPDGPIIEPYPSPQPRPSDPPRPSKIDPDNERKADPFGSVKGYDFTYPILGNDDPNRGRTVDSSDWVIVGDEFPIPIADSGFVIDAPG